MVVGIVVAFGGLARLSEGVPNAPFAGYSGYVGLKKGGERGLEDGGTDGAGD